MYSSLSSSEFVLEWVGFQSLTVDNVLVLLQIAQGRTG